MSFGKVVGERGLPSVGGSSSLQARASSFMAFGLMSALGLGMLAWYYSHAINHDSQAHERAQAAAKNRLQGDIPLPALGRIEPLRVATSDTAASDASHSFALASAEAPLAEAPAVKAHPNSSQGYGPAANPVKTQAQSDLERRLAGIPFARRTDHTVEGQGSGSAYMTGGMPGSLNSLSETTGAASQGGGQAGRLSTLLSAAVVPAVFARVLPTQRLLLPRGAFIDCTLETAIDTSLPGMTTCVTATDTFSADGQVVLLDRGTKLVGEIQSQVQQGSSRVFVLWTEARTPSGVVVPLASPGTDELGRSGLSGEVNRHFWDRFGAAILVSVIDVALQSTRQAGAGGTVIYSPSASVDIVTDLLKSTVNIAPTVVKNQGDRIQVFVARDLDFRSVYELRAQ